MSAERHALPGQRWHFQHGPIDIVIGADGEASAVQAAHEAAWLRFTTVLDELVCELPELRQPVGERCTLVSAVARRMWQACQPYRTGFVTPMAAVAGSVAQELIEHYARPGVQRAWVNNGGDIALHLAHGESIRVGLFADLARFDVAAAQLPLQTDGQMTVHATLPVRGVATSGWRGRSFSFGIADSVTVLARTAAQADVAATLIANAVNVPDARIERRPANELRHDTDLGDRPVTFHVPTLDQATVLRAVRAGQRMARELQASDLIWSAVIVCQGWSATAGGEPGHAGNAWALEHDVRTSFASA
jgi:ApbE superfamily uncharacterized protein (UPF0280 family)